MLQKSKSRKIRQVKYILLLPFITFFIYSFNIEEVYKVNNDVQANKGKPGFVMPIAQKDLTRMKGYGMRVNPFTKKSTMHNGVDYTANKGAKVFASATGTVLTVGENSIDGKYIKISHADNYQTNYFHLSSINVKNNQKVLMGETIGKVGSTGQSVAPHLHFEMLKNDDYLNPWKILNPKKRVASHTSIIYMFDKNSSDNYLKELAKTLHKETGAKLNINVKRNNRENIISFNLIIIFPNAKEASYKYEAKERQEIEKTYIKIIEEGKIAIWNKSKMSMFTIDLNDVKEKNKPKITPTPLYIINGKKQTGNLGKAALNKDKFHSVHIYRGKEAVKRYGSKAKNGVIKMYKDGSGFIKFKGVQYVYNIKDNKVRFYNKFGDIIKKDLAEKLRLKLIDDDIANKHVMLQNTSVAGGNYIKYKGKMYYFVEAERGLVFYNQFGKKVGVKLSKELEKVLDKK